MKLTATLLILMSQLQRKYRRLAVQHVLLAVAPKIPFHPVAGCISKMDQNQCQIFDSDIILLYLKFLLRTFGTKR